MRKPSLFPGTDCYLCGSPYTHLHHIFPGAGRRDVSDREGCTVHLCYEHHNGSNRGVHFDREFDRELRAECQRRWEEREGIRDHDHAEFIRLFGRNYIMED